MSAHGEKEGVVGAWGEEIWEWVEMGVLGRPPSQTGRETYHPCAP